MKDKNSVADRGVDGSGEIVLMANWILRSEPRKDHACAECIGSMVVRGFRCGYHIAEKYLQEQLERPIPAEKSAGWTYGPNPNGDRSYVVFDTHMQIHTIYGDEFMARNKAEQMQARYEESVVAALATPPAEQVADSGEAGGSRESKMVVLRRNEAGAPTVWCDPGIIDLVDALNVGELSTVASCSGHGGPFGVISLSDGRELLVFPDWDSTRFAERAVIAALAAQPAAERPDSKEHPSLKVPIDPQCSAKLNDLGDDRGQGLDAYWKYGFRTGWHYAKNAQAQPAVGQVAMTDGEWLACWHDMFPSDRNSHINGIKFARAMLAATGSGK